MDRFLTIDWNLPLESIIDDTFISEERLERDSVMQKITRGTFTDPFKNIEEDYKEIDIDLIKSLDPDLSDEDIKNEIATHQPEREGRSQQINSKSYVPGVVKSLFRFPRKSKLSKEQQAMCLRVLLRFSEPDRPKLTQTEREELQNYLELKQIIAEEQNEFLEFAKAKWQERSFRLVCEDYINLRWKSKLHEIYKLPRYYAEVTNVPFKADKTVELKFISDCLQMGSLPKIVLPNFTKRCMLYADSQLLRKRFPPEKTIGRTSINFKLPVSEDPTCQKLAEANDVDLVISSSGLNCLVNNIDSSYSNSWILPLVVKRHNDKNVIYINKAAPPAASNILEKNNWVQKYILRSCLIKAKKSPSEKENDNIFEDITAEKLLRLEEEFENSLTRVDKTPRSNVKKEEQNIDDSIKQLNVKSETDNSEHASSSNVCSASSSRTNSPDIENKAKLASKDNVSYKLFSIGPKLSEQNELMKDVIKEYKILVRTKTDGVEVLENNVQRLLLLAPKLEYQPDLGAEAVTLQEALKQWISLVFRPYTFLSRVRILAKTLEMIQVEHRSAMSISNEIKRLYNIKVEDSLIILHNVIQSLANLSPGRYVMRHTIRNRAFAAVYKEVENPGTNFFDMRMVYGEEFHTLHNTPWIPLDKTIATPMLKLYERMPAMFYPCAHKMYPKKKTVPTQTNQGSVRRSLRNRKKKSLS